jgi:hypothetical protein
MNYFMTQQSSLTPLKLVLFLCVMLCQYGEAWAYNPKFDEKEYAPHVEEEETPASIALFLTQRFRLGWYVDSAVRADVNQDGIADWIGIIGFREGDVQPARRPQKGAPVGRLSYIEIEMEHWVQLFVFKGTKNKDYVLDVQTHPAEGCGYGMHPCEESINVVRGDIYVWFSTSGVYQGGTTEYQFQYRKGTYRLVGMTESLDENQDDKQIITDITLNTLTGRKTVQKSVTPYDAKTGELGKTRVGKIKTTAAKKTALRLDDYRLEPIEGVE